jgi:hypothetical protein
LKKLLIQPHSGDLFVETIRSKPNTSAKMKFTKYLPVLLLFVSINIFGQATKDTSFNMENIMKNRGKYILHGILRKKMTVGYRSPYILVTETAKEFEIRESEQVNRDILNKFIGKNVEINGLYIFTPSEKADSGSEAASRFINGIIPSMEYIEVRNIRRMPNKKK